MSIRSGLVADGATPSGAEPEGIRAEAASALARLASATPPGGMVQPEAAADPDRNAREGPSLTAPAGSVEAMASAAAPRLGRPSVGAGAVTVRLSGFDPGAPRELTLWRVEQEGAARLARTRSAEDGAFAFPEIAVVESELAVTARSEGAESARSRIHLAALERPSVVAVRIGGPGLEVLRIWPSASASRVIVANVRGEIASVAVALGPSAAERAISVPLEADAGGTLWVTEEDGEGRPSGWQRIDAAP